MTQARRRLLMPGLTVTVALLALLSLGSWQVYRLRWKQAILARIEAAELSAPIPLGADPQPYSKVWVAGHFRFDLAAQFGAEVRDTRTGPTMGTHQIVPLQLDSGRSILVDRGWFPQAREIAPDDPPDTVKVIGYLRPREGPHWFSPADSIATRQFYTLDTEAIASAIGLSALMPFTLVALEPISSGSFPTPAQHLPTPSNNHLTYAITWYALAVALIVIFIAWARRST